MALGAARRPRLAPDAPLEALLGSDVALCDLLRARKVKTAQELLYTPPWELRDWLLVSEAQATAVLERAWAACAAPAASAWDSLQAAAAGAGLVPTPLVSLNEALAGSLSGTFVEAAGPPGAGKTQLCLHVAALTAVSGGEVFWLDAERTFSPPRVLELLQSICRGRAAAAGGAAAGDPEAAALAALQRIRRRVCGSLQELHGLVSDLLQRAQQGDVLPALLVVDSIAALARNTGDAMANQQFLIPQRQRMLSSLASMLKMLAATPIAPDSSTPPGILVTNQVMGDPNSGGSKVALGYVWGHAVNWRLVLSYLPPGDARGHGTKERAADERFLHLEKSPAAAALTICYRIGPGGLQEVGAPARGEPLPLRWGAA